MGLDGICLISLSDNSDHQEILYSLYDALKDRIRVYTIGIANPKAADTPQGTDNYYVECPKRPGITKDTFRLGKLNKIAQIIKKLNVKFVYFESLHLWNIFLMMKLPRDIICIEAAHDILPHNNSFVRKECQKIACRMASAVVLHNQKGMQQFSEIYGIPLDRLYYITLWKNFPKERPIAATADFLSFGRIRKYKGLDALEKIIEKTTDISYKVVGSPDDESKPQVEKLKTLKNVFVDDREVDVAQMEKYFTDCGWIVLPYESASQSGVIIDAYRFSRPVIAFDVGAINEQVKDGESGFLVPAGDVDAFIETVRKAHGLTKEERARMSDAAYKFGRNIYGAESAVEPFLNIIEKVGETRKQ